jgi:hypothetical protein
MVAFFIKKNIDLFKENRKKNQKFIVHLPAKTKYLHTCALLTMHFLLCLP